MVFGKVWKSPLLHFFALGAILFAGFAVVSGEPAASPPDRIDLSADQARRLAAEFTAIWNRPPSEAELDRLIADWAREEAFVREALALGLDKDDAVIRQRLALKMQFLAESGAAAMEPDEATLAAYLADNREEFTRPARFAFEQILLPDGATEADIAAIREMAGDTDPATLGERTMLPASLSLTPAPAIDRAFGEGFAAALAAQPVGAWGGPVESGYGAHLVRVNDRSEPALPPLADIRETVAQTWRAEQADEMREAFTAALLSRYTLDLPAADAVLAIPSPGDVLAR
ncbi:peptidyl-prolyl cis-trans isomerase [Acuticoccus sp. M5D2P5]|uniref:peptidylprolyl isomerase n=1 Tax=Acuticoccus kalidii TaxID=2910977 RepID=UPI001F16EDBA|nr:peptidylprolyl isomerase [Acuticoccus kalidii]MCF3934819.1 peptidyl-prolyl cis-trans isomerase [Acuticoccus kalidii]